MALQIQTYGNLDLAGDPSNRARIDQYFAQLEEQNRQRALAQQQAQQQANDVAGQRQILADRAGYAANQSVLDAQINAGAANIQAGLQGQRDVNQANLQSYLAAQHAGLQGQLASQQEGIQARQGERNVDLQARLQQITLSQQEQMRLDRLRQARGAVAANPDLSPQERQNLLTQIETGLNPLENRQREAQTIHTQVQTQGMFQQNAMQAQLFNQQQSIRTMNLEDRIRNITDANGNTATFFLNSNGDAERMDFSQEQRATNAANMALVQGAQGVMQSQQYFPGQLQAQQANIAHTQAGTESLRYQTGRAQRFEPTELAGMVLNNQTRAQALDLAQQLQPHQINSAALQVMDQTRALNQNYAMDPYRQTQAWANAQQAVTDMYVSALSGPDRIRHQAEIVRGLQQSNDFNRDTSQTRARTLTAQLNGLLQSNSLAEQTAPLAVSRLAAQVEQAKLDLAQGRAVAPLTIQRLQSEISNLNEQRAGAWMNNTVRILNAMYGPGGAGAGRAGGAAGGAGGVGGGVLSPVQQLRHREWVDSQVTRDIERENTARTQLGRPRMTGPELTQFEAASRERHTNSTDGALHFTSGFNERQWLQFGQMLAQAPEDVRQRLAALRVPGAQGGPGQEQGPPAPPNGARQIIPRIEQDINLLNAQIGAANNRGVDNRQAGLGAPPVNVPANFNTVAARRRRDALQGITELMRNATFTRDDIATVAGYLQTLRNDPHEMDLIRYFERHDRWGILAANLR